MAGKLSLALILVIALGAFNVASASDCPTQADILIMVDASGSIKESDFDELKLKIADFVGRNIGDLDVNYAFQLYGTFVSGVVTFNGHSIDPAIVARFFLFYEGQQSYANKALKLAADFFTPENGARDGALKYIILFTDGDYTFQEATKTAAKDLKDSGIEILVMGVGKNVSMGGVGQVASDGTGCDADNLEDFTGCADGFVKTIEDRVDKLCNVCPTEADVLIIVDSSASIVEADFDALKVKISQFVSNDIGGLDTNYAFSSYSSMVSMVTRFNFAIDPTIVATHFLHYQGGQSYTHEALADVTSYYEQANGHRPGALKVVILYTDGHATDMQAAVDQSDSLQSEGYQIFVIGVGNNVTMSGVNELASPDSGYDAENLGEVESAHADISLAVKNKIPEVCDPCPAMVDVLIIFDASASINESDFDQVRDIDATFVASGAVGGLDTHYAFMTIGTFVVKVSMFEQLPVPASVIAQSFIFYEGQQSHMTQGLTVAQEYFEPANGYRQGALKQIIFYTDGVATNQATAIEEADRLKNQGVTISVIGVGNSVQMDKVQDLASPGEAYDGSDLSTVAGHLASVSDGVAATAKELCEETCPNMADIVILVDGSSSIDETTVFDPLKIQIGEWVEMTIPDLDINYAFASFDSMFKPVFNFKNMEDLSPSLTPTYAASLIFYGTGQSKVSEALLSVKDYFGEDMGGRDGALKYVILYTDADELSADATAASQEVLDAGITIMGVGIGEQLNMTGLVSLATPGYVYDGSDITTIGTAGAAFFQGKVEDEIAQLCG